MGEANGGGPGWGEWGGTSIVGVVLIVVGSIFLVDRLGIFHSAWSVLWPVILIVVGVIVIVNVAGRRDHGSLAAALGVTSSAVGRDGAARLELEVTVGGGTFRLGGGSGQLVEVCSSAADVAAQQRHVGDLAQVRLRQDVASFGGWRADTNWEIRTASDIPTRLRFDAGAGSFDLDLSAIWIVEARLQVGAARAGIVLPRPHGGVQITINGGAASVSITVPSGVDYRLEATGGFNSVNGRTESPGFAAATDRVEIRFQGGAASVRIG